MSEESRGFDRLWEQTLEIYREEWEILLHRAKLRGYEGVSVHPYVSGLVDALDSDRGVGILEAVSGRAPDDWRAALHDLLLRELRPAGGLIVWCVVRVSPSGRIREMRNIHATELSARRYVGEHPLPARKGWLLVEAWLVASGDEDTFEEVERRVVERTSHSLSTLLTELTDDEVALYAVWVQRPDSQSVPRELARRFKELEDHYLGETARHRQGTNRADKGERLGTDDVLSAEAECPQPEGAYAEAAEDPEFMEEMRRETEAWDVAVGDGLDEEAKDPARTPRKDSAKRRRRRGA